MKTKTLIKLSLIIDKMGIADEIKAIDKPTNEEVGKELIMLLITNLHKVEEEIYDFVVYYKDLLKQPVIDENIDNYEEMYKKEYEKNYKIALKEAQDYDVISIIKELVNIEGMKDFL